jgi:short-subunit dehydrogenase
MIIHSAKGGRSMSFVERYGPWAVVAGASEGTGRAFARKIASNGVPCILVARREGPLATLAEEIRSESGLECITAAIDLTSPDATDRIVAAVGDREVGLFVSNAGADTNGARFLDRDLDAWLDHVRLNVITTLSCCYHFGRLMRARRKGGLLLVNSGACYGGASFMAAYTASKAFALNFGESLWAELRPHGVDVLSLVLGRTDTPAFRKLLAEKGQSVPPGLASPDDVAEMGLARLPEGPVHNWGLADDVAGYAPSSAAARRARILAIDVATREIYGD